MQDKKRPAWFALRNEGHKVEIYDPVRRKYVALTPEEEVRQKMLRYLVEDSGVPLGLVAVEYQIKIDRLVKRCDIVVYSRQGTPLMIVECKSNQVKLDQKTIEQAALYNIRLKVNYITITNGLQTYCCKRNQNGESFTLLAGLPSYNEMNKLVDRV